MRVLPLASSSAGNAIALEEEGSLLLLDAGIPFRKLQVALRHRASALEGVLLTHEHADHSRAIADLLGKAHVEVFATEGTLDALGIPPVYLARVVEPLEPFRAGAWTALAFPVRHDAREPVGYLVRSPAGAKILYLTDASSTSYRFRDLTHVLVEANHAPAILDRAVESGSTDASLALRIRQNHLSLAGALAVLEATNVETIEEIWLIHLSDGHSDARAFRDAVERATGRPTFVAGHPGSLA